VRFDTEHNTYFALSLARDYTTI